MPHTHHGHAHGRSPERRISVAFFLNLGFALLEIAGGLWTNSMAILADALHDLGDSLALGITWRFTSVSQRRGDAAYTFGYRRFSLLGALFMGVFLVVGGVIVLLHSVPRILRPEIAHAEGMIALAIVGVLVNGIAAWRMIGGSSLSERIVTWHFIEDIMGWLAVLLAAVAMRIWGLYILDPILSVLITLYVLWNVGKRLKQVLLILLQRVPEGLSVAEVESEIASVPGVLGVHHTHMWSQDGEHHVLSTHVACDPETSVQAAGELRAAIKAKLKSLTIPHATIEIEPCTDEGCPDACDACYQA
jgi:cobalt-zinc-cadmium efflux system protein